MLRGQTRWRYSNVCVTGVAGKEPRAGVLIHPKGGLAVSNAV